MGVNVIGVSAMEVQSISWIKALTSSGKFLAMIDKTSPGR